MKNNIDGINKQALLSFCILGILGLVLVIRLWQLQAMNYPSYHKLAQINAARSMPVIAPRGVIIDRYGRLLVSNKAVFSVYILQTEIKDKKSMAVRLSSLISMPPGEILNKLSLQKTRPFDPILIKANIPAEIVSKIEEEKSILQGVVVNVRPVRVYPNKSVAAHVLGYVGEVTAQDLEKNTSLNLRPADLIGKTGVEKIYDPYLRGVNGGERMSISMLGRPGDVKGVEESIPGKNLQLTLDLELQKACEAALGGNSGAVVALEASNGEVLALASHPGYDPNIFSGPISTEQWERLRKSNHPFLNRALSVYPPGSIFKAISLAAALEGRFFNPSDRFFCKGFFKIGERTAKCWKLSGHGNLNLLEGLVQSCDVVFYNVGLKLGPHILHDAAHKFGLGDKTGIDLPAEADGVIPSSEWKKRVYKTGWYPGDSINFAIGQGYLWVTPLQMANVYGFIANGARRYEPHLIKNIKDREGKEVFSYKPKVIGEMPISPHNLALVKNALHDTVLRGTGRGARIPTFEAAGKTGTAENPRKPPHAWFVCYAPYDNPKIVIASFVEYGQHGDQVTARIARDILKWYSEHRVNIRLIRN